MDLIIVESPTKAKTITKFIDKKYKVESSFGHVRDLPKSTMGIDIENNFEPKYVIPDKARKNFNKLKELAKKADKVILATDEDREGEAIAWHLMEALKLKKEDTGRIVFHEITKSAILEALEDQKEINYMQVDAQQARRVLDRLVGYEMSPFLWKKVAKGLSAGRVQSVAVRLVVEKEREIKAFNPEEYWSIDGDFTKINDDQIITAKLNKKDGKTIDKFDINNKELVDEVLKELDKKDYEVSKVTKKETKRKAPNPFTTSTLQQTANRWLGYSAKQTMVVAQKLYEQGHITYMRTDSFNLSGKFTKEAKIYLDEKHGGKYSLSEARVFKTKSKGAQEAHEAIRPTEASNSPEVLEAKLESSQFRLYKLIWERSVASQMPEAIMYNTAIDIDAKSTPYQFRANGQVLKFDGFLKIYQDKSKELQLPDVTEGEKLNLKRITDEQHFTKPPARYSDATLVKVLEQHGIGRPSTYAPTISTIEARNYVARDDNKRLYPNDIAFVVIDLLVEHFKDVVDYEFTAKLEDDLDSIAHGKNKWQPIIENFYTPFHKNLENKYNEINKEDIMPEEKSNVKCDKCGAAMIVKTGRYGKFLACSAFPDCKNIKGMEGDTPEAKEKSEEVKKLEEKYNGEKCDKCSSEMAIKNGRFGPFLACTGYPDCKNIKNIKENNSSTGVTCPSCGKGEIVAKRSKRGVFYACDQYPDCKTAYFAKPTGDKCPECEGLLIENKESGAKCSRKGCDYTK